MNKEKYLERIGVAYGSLRPGFDELALLQKRHLLNIPFENLDIHLGRKITLDIGKFYKKIVADRRGGFCYELNGLFNELLIELGYKTKLVSARVANRNGVFGEEYDHLAIIAEIDRREFLVDVGFGDFTAEPIRLDFKKEQQDENGIFRLSDNADGYISVSRKRNGSWNDEYIFQNVERGLEEFAGMCVHNQTSSESHFTKGRLCSLMTANGRKTLTDKKFIVTKNDDKIETEIDSEKSFLQHLKKEFDIELK